MPTEVLQAMSEHVNYEYYSAYIYLQLGLDMEKNNYMGYSKWLIGHYHKELNHAEDFIDFMLKRDQTPELLDIKMENYTSVEEPLEAAKIIYDHEKDITQRLYKLNDVAKKVDDYATEIFMHSFIVEQIEEEDITKDIVDRFELAGDNIAAKILVDQELARLAKKAKVEEEADYKEIFRNK